MRNAAAPLLTLTAIWGCSFLFIKVGDEGLTALQVSGARIVLGSLALLVLLRVRGEKLPRGRGMWADLVGVALLNNVIPFSLLSWGEERISSSLAGVFNATTALWTALVALLLFREDRLTLSRGAGLLLGFAGVILVFAPWNAGGGTVTGDLACVGAGLSYGLGIVYTRRRLQGRATSLSLAAGQVTAAAAVMIVVVAVAGRHEPDLTWRLSGSILLLGVFGTGVAYALFFGLIAGIGPTRASTVTYLVPIVAVTLGVAVLGEHLAATTVAGALVILAGVGLTSVPTAGARPQPG